MIDFLIFIKTFIQIALTTRRAPKNIPFMWFSWSKTVSLRHWSYKLIIKPQHFIKKFTVFNMIAFLISVKLHSVRYHLFFSYSFENNVFWLWIFWATLILLWASRLAVEEALCNCMWSTHWWIHSPISYSSRAINWTLTHSIWK
jgi:hypothetical protein